MKTEISRLRDRIDRLTAENKALREQLFGEVVSRFEVVGEADDKCLHGFTEGDKQESTHDSLTFDPDNWDLGTVLVVYAPKV